MHTIIGIVGSVKTQSAQAAKDIVGIEKGYSGQTCLYSLLILIDKQYIIYIPRFSAYPSGQSLTVRSMNLTLFLR